MWQIFMCVQQMGCWKALYVYLQPVCCWLLQV